MLNLKNYNLLYASNFNFNSATYVNIQDGAGNNVFVSITKADGTNIFVRAEVSHIQNGAVNDTVNFGVNDGTTDYTVTEVRDSNSIHAQSIGEYLITGLAGGTYTMTLRGKVAGPNQVNMNNAQHSVSLTVMEVAAP